MFISHTWYGVSWRDRRDQKFVHQQGYIYFEICLNSVVQNSPDTMTRQKRTTYYSLVVSMKSPYEQLLLERASQNLTLTLDHAIQLGHETDYFITRRRLELLLFDKATGLMAHFGRRSQRRQLTRNVGQPQGILHFRNGAANPLSPLYLVLKSRGSSSIRR